MKRLNELRAQRNTLVTQARGLLDKAEAEKRGLSTDEQTQYDKIFADQESLRSQIQTEERQLDLERELAGQEGQRSRQAGNDDDANLTEEQRSARARSQAFRTLLTDGARALNPDQWRALSAGAAALGGFTVAPEEFVTTLIKAVDDEVFVRRYANRLRITKSQNLGAPTLDADPADSDWTGEIQTGSEDSTMAFGKREMIPSPLAKRIKVSNKLLAVSALPIENLVAQRLAYKFAITQEKAFFLGTGANQPLGVFTAHNSGVPTGRDVSTGNTTTAITFDGLISAKYGLKSQHQKKARWAFHRDGVAMIAKLKDNNNQYLWQPSKKEGEPDMVLGLPMDMSEYVPNTFTTGKYVGILANWGEGYWIADAMDLQVQVLKELYAETNQTGYIGRLETDGAPVLAEAFSRVKLA